MIVPCGHFELCGPHRRATTSSAAFGVLGASEVDLATVWAPSLYQHRIAVEEKARLALI